MTHLRSCYFCGATGALSAYATLPEDLRGDDEPSRRVVLCSGCHTKLTNILTPIVDRLQREAGGEPPGRSGTRSDGSRTDAGGTPSSSTSTGQPEVTFSGSATRDETAESDPESEPRESSLETESIQPDDDADTDDTDPGVSTPEAGRSGSTVTSESTASEPAEPAESSESSETDATGHGSDASSPSEASETASTEVSDRLERVYHQLLRFLRNREFPIPRSEAELIAQSAYDLSATEASEVIQLTVDRDVLEERGGELHRR